MSKILKPFLGKLKYQKLFERLYNISLKGMNVGELTDVSSSGELFTLNYIKQSLKDIEDSIIFDVGANIGDYTKLIDTVFNSKARIFSFEPSQTTYLKLVNNTKVLTQVKTHNFGFGDEECEIPLFGNDKESLVSSLYQRKLDHFDMAMEKLENVQIKTIDKFCLNNEIKHINFLKIDVEGHEKKVLQGAKEMITSNRIDFIQFEFGGCNVDSKTYFQDFFYLLKDNYKIYRIVKDGLFEIKEYKESYEIFITTNYLAVKNK